MPTNTISVIITKKGDKDIEGLTDSNKPNRLCPKRAGKLKKFLESNTLLNQEWIMEPKKKVKDILSEVAGKEKIEIERFVRYKVGEGV